MFMNKHRNYFNGIIVHSTVWASLRLIRLYFCELTISVACRVKEKVVKLVGVASCPVNTTAFAMYCTLVFCILM